MAKGSAPKAPARPPDIPPIMVDQNAGGGGGFMSKKVLGLPLPVVLGAAVIIAFIVYRHYQNSTASASTSSSTFDPNAIDPNTGVPFAQEEAAYTSGLQGTPSGNGTGVGGVGGDTGGLSAGDLSNLIAAIEAGNQQNAANGSTYNYYSGSGSGEYVSNTFTNPNSPGAGTTTSGGNNGGASASSTSGGGGGGGGVTPQTLSETQPSATDVHTVLSEAPNASLPQVAVNQTPVAYNPTTAEGKSIQAAASAVAGTYGTGDTKTGSNNGTGSSTVKNAYNSPKTSSHLT